MGKGVKGLIEGGVGSFEKNCVYLKTFKNKPGCFKLKQPGFI
ncbi:hypothetical protein EMIT036CA2_10795 [Chryseobacterium sp. IT-36CA2]